MSSFVNYPGHGPEYLIDGFSWSSIGKGTVVDLGGSGGHISIALAQSFPDLKFVVQDLPRTIEAVDKTGIPENVVDRVEFMAHDFMTEQVVEADIYLFRWIFHNWSDSSVVRILRQLISALKPGARVIINDYLLSEPNTADLMKERFERLRSIPYTISKMISLT